MTKRLIFSFTAGFLFLIVSCTSSKLAQQNNQNDDVYNSSAKAREVKYVQYTEQKPVQQEQKQYAQQDSTVKQDRNPNYVTSQELYGESRNQDRYDDDSYYDYDQNYSARIYRFRNYSPWRGYYDSYYDYQFDPYYSSNYYYNRPSIGISIGIWHPYNYYSYNPWNCFGSTNYYGNYWGPYSYYNSYYPSYYGGGYGGNGYYGGYYGGGYYGGGYGGNHSYSSPSSRTRPNRETENIHSGGSSYDPNINNNHTGDRIENSNPDINRRPERYSNPANNSGNQGSSPQSTGNETRPSRPSRSNDSGNSQPNHPQQQQSEPSKSSRPQRESSAPPQVEKQSSPPPSSSPTRSSGSSSGGNSRPSRSGGK